MRKKVEEDRKYSWFDVPRAIWYFLGEQKAKYVVLNALLFAVFFYDLVPAYVLGKIVDFFSQYHIGDSMEPFYIYAIGLGLSSIVIAYIRLTSKNILGRIAIAAKTKARVDGFERLMDFSLQWRSEENSGNRVQRIFTGSQAIKDLSHSVSNELFPILTAFIGVLSIFLFLSPIFLLFFLFYAGSFFIIEYIFNRKLEQLNSTHNRYQEKSSGVYMEGAGNVLAIQALGVESELYGRVKATEENTKEADIAIHNIRMRKWYSFQTLNGVALAVFLFLVATQLIAGLITVGYILVFFSYFEKLRGATGQATDVTAKLIELKSGLLRMMPLFWEGTQIQTGSENFPKHWNTIAIRNGTIRYAADRVALRHMHFTVGQNEIVGIVGRSGSGKSTLVKVLLGLYKLEKGTFTVDDKNYYDIAHHSTAKQMAVVPQETELFNFSVRANITLMRSVPPDLLHKAIDIAQLKEVIRKLPHGLETLVGERGYALSGGERQRIGIARAVCKNAPILILDEATSSLDTQTERVVIKKLFTHLRDKTMVIVAHRLSTLQEVDRLVVFSKGSIVEEGTFKHLKAQPDSIFRQLYDAQEG